jgi:transcriptional regulator with XRE-family HTH domain
MTPIAATIHPVERPPMPANKNSVTLPYLRQWRARALLTQKQLAEAAKLNPWTVTRAERGAPISILSAERIARALGMTIRQLQQEPD